MFTIHERERLRDRILQLAQDDPRIVAGAVVGSLALTDGDRWSDLDLTFAVADEFAIEAVLEAWSQMILQEFKAAHLFDLPSGASIYRVFLLPGCLQFDLSFTPASKFGASGPKFKLLFGQAVEKPHVKPMPVQELFGYAVHHLVRARFCIERGRLWQAEYWISAGRDFALNLACLNRGLPSNNGRGYDDLPESVHNSFRGSLVSTLERESLLRALGITIQGLLQQTEPIQNQAVKIEPWLRELSKDG